MVTPSTNYKMLDRTIRDADSGTIVGVSTGEQRKPVHVSEWHVRVGAMRKLSLGGDSKRLIDNSRILEMLNETTIERRKKLIGSRRSQTDDSARIRAPVALLLCNSSSSSSTSKRSKRRSRVSGYGICKIKNVYDAT